jgi:hypothetical protein
MPDHYLRKYGVATTIDFQLYKLDGTGLKVDAASATGDIKIMKDEGAEANTTADAFVDEGQGYSLALTATEMTAARVVIYIVDLSAPQVWLDKVLIIETYGNASAQHIFDLGIATVNLSSTSEGQIDTIDTNAAAIAGKLPTNKIMGSSGVTDKDDEIDAIKVMTDKIGTIVNTGGTATIGAILGDFANSALVTRVAAVKSDTAAIKAITDLLTLAAINTEVDTALNTAIPGSPTADSVNERVKATDDKLPTNYIMGSAVLTAKDDEIDAIKTMTDKIGTVTNTGGTATIGAILGDFANSALVTRIINMQTELNKIGTITNTGGTATIGAVLGDVANSALAARLILIASYIDTEVGAIKAKTDLIGASVALEAAGNLAAVKAKTDLIPADIVTQLDTNVPAIKAKTDVMGASVALESGGNVAAVKAKTDLIGASVALETGGNVAAIKAITDLLTLAAINAEVDTALNTAIPASNAATSVNDILLDVLTLAAINAEVDNALVDVDLDHMVKTTIGAGKPTVGTLMDKVLNKNGSQTFDPTTDSLEAIRDNQAGADAAAIADAVWDEAIAGHTTGTTFGGKNQKVVPSETVNDYKADVSALALESGGNLAAVKAKTDLLPADTATQLDTNIPAIKAKTDLIGASVALETGGNLAAIAGKLPTNKIMGSSVVTDKDDEIDAIKAKTDLIGASVALESGGNVAAVKAKTDLIGASVALESGGNLATVLAESQSHPTLAEIEATTILAKEATFTHATYGIDKIKTETAAIKAKTDIIGASVALESAGNLATVKAKTDLIGASVALESAGNLAAVKTKTDLIPADITTQLDTNVPAIKAKTDIIGATVALESGGNLAAVLADTNELQTDWVNGGRLDLLLDSIISKVDVVDGIVDAIKLITDALTLAAIADAVHDEIVDGSMTLRQSIRLIDSALFGKLSGGGTATLIFRDVDDTKNRITATVDASFNRTAVTKVAT